MDAGLKNGKAGKTVQPFMSGVYKVQCSFILIRHDLYHHPAVYHKNHNL
jgi:hypothetical protein